MIEAKIRDLKANLMAQSTRVESMIEQTFKAIKNNDVDALKKIKKEDEQKVNKAEVNIDELCTAIMALYSPEARDLRLVISFIKINATFERMGDLIVNITESGRYLLENPLPVNLDELYSLAEETMQMVHKCITAFAKEEELISQSVLEADDIVDRIANNILTNFIKESGPSGDTNQIEYGLHVLRIAYNLERIADLSTNIAEVIIFIAKGLDVRHNKS